VERFVAGLTWTLVLVNVFNKTVTIAVYNMFVESLLRITQ